MFDDVIDFIKNLYEEEGAIPLHRPRFIGNEKKYLNDCIDSSFVSTAGEFVNQIELKIAQYTGSKFAIATSNGTSSLHISLLIAGVSNDDEVITQPLTFVATCNAISYCGASPIFLDVEKETLGLSPVALELFLSKNTIIKDQKCINLRTGKTIKACVPVHTFGHPCRVDQIKKICDKYKISLIEDAAESLGSFYKKKHTGTFGLLGAISFNGNKIVTAGGGGCILTDNEELAKKAKHLSTTARVPHKWEYTHDKVGYNYRMPNLNAALLLAQIESIEFFLKNKRNIAMEYESFFSSSDFEFIKEPKNSSSNYWLNAILLKNKKQRDLFLKEANSKGVMARPIWNLMHKLDIFKKSESYDLKNSEWLENRIVNLPSSVNLK